MSDNVHNFTVSQMSCEHCVNAITESVSQVPGVEVVDIDLDAKTVTVTGGDQDLIVAAIDDAGYDVDS